MADPRDPSAKPDPSEREPGEGVLGDVSIESDEVEAPRRAASARFVVDSDVGADALLRDAMDPANRSLAEALRLSYRVLQVVMLALLVLFVFSGVQAVEEDESGVLLRWGKILRVDGSEALAPGTHFSIWPYPIGEFVLVQARTRAVDLGNRYWPNLKNRTFEEAVQQATIHDRLHPRQDGSILMIGGDIAHVKLRGDYVIDLPEVYLRTLADRSPGGLDGDRLVSLALERALVHAAARRTLEDFVDFDDAEKEDVVRAAQGLLDLAGSGIALSSVATPEDPTPALAIKREFGALQDARVNSDLLITSARQEAHNRLVSVAGERYPEIVQHIEEYERAIGAGEEAAAADRLDRLREVLSSAEAAGEITTILEQARSYRAQIEATLGNEARRFAGLLPAYRAHPELVRSRLLADKRSEVLGRADTEVVVVPAGTGALRIALTGIEQVKVDRRKQGLARAEAEKLQGQFSADPYYRRLEEMFEGRAGRTFTPEGKPFTGGQ